MTTLQERVLHLLDVPHGVSWRVLLNQLPPRYTTEQVLETITGLTCMGKIRVTERGLIYSAEHTPGAASARASEPG